MFRHKILIILLAMLAGISIGLSQQQIQSYNRLDFNLDYKLSDYSIQKFYIHLEKRLPLYKKIFEKYSDKNNIHWTFLAAVAYQESKWDESATSYTGVKGLMQLTSQTAEHIGIEDREDAYQSIKGGAFYLRYLYDKTDSSKSETERWIQTLCAYNLGWGHLKDVHRLAKALNKDPYDWEDLRELLPLLQSKKYSKHLRYGFARGNETIDFVEKVFTYHNLLIETVTFPSFMVALK